MEDLHAAVDALRIRYKPVAIAVHALVALGVITELKCQMPRCLYPDEPFSQDGSGNTRALSLDHIERRSLGGSDHPSNIRIAHMGCNRAWAHGTTMPVKQRAKISSALKGRRIGAARPKL